MQNGLRFESIKEDRDWYFVEYSPPTSGYLFAILTLTIPQGDHSLEQIAVVMEAESASWLKRYPIPLMISAFNSAGDVVNLETVRGCNHLIGYLHAETADVVQAWRLVGNEELPRDALDKAHLQDIYADIPSKTKEDITEQVLEESKKLRVGWWMVFVWAVVVPAAIAVLEWWSDWLGVVVLLYSLGKAVKKALQITGRWPHSSAEKQKEEEEARMRHHHYHCERNPEGFLRLKIENFDRWSREEIQKEALSLKSSRK